MLPIEPVLLVLLGVVLVVDWLPVVDWFCVPTAVEPEFVVLSGVAVVGVPVVLPVPVVFCVGVIWPDVLDVLLL